MLAGTVEEWDDENDIADNTDPLCIPVDSTEPQNFCNRAEFYCVNDNMTYCSNVGSLMDTLGRKHKPEE